MKGFLTLLTVFACAGCTIQYEDMAKNNPASGDRYKYLVAQVGGQVTSQSSMGTALAADNQKSFADFMQTAGVAFAGWTAASVQKAKEISSQLAAKEITKQQAAAGLKEVQLAELAAKGGATSEAIKAGAEVAPIVITAP